MAGILATLLKQWTGDCAHRFARLKADVKPTSESRAIATFAGTLLGVVKQNPKTIPSVLTAAVAFCGLVYQY